MEKVNLKTCTITKKNIRKQPKVQEATKEKIIIEAAIRGVEITEFMSSEIIEIPVSLFYPDGCFILYQRVV